MGQRSDAKAGDCATILKPSLIKRHGKVVGLDRYLR
jgi:hypothetical protein